MTLTDPLQPLASSPLRPNSIMAHSVQFHKPLGDADMIRFILLLFVAILLSACSRAEDPLENVVDISLPDHLSGCVLRDDDGACEKAVCVEDEEGDCKAFVKACEKFDYVSDVRLGHDTCERQSASAE